MWDSVFWQGISQDFGHEHYVYFVTSVTIILCGTWQDGLSLSQGIDTLYPSKLQTGALLNPYHSIFWTKSYTTYKYCKYMYKPKKPNQGWTTSLLCADSCTFHFWISNIIWNKFGSLTWRNRKSSFSRHVLARKC